MLVLHKGLQNDLIHVVCILLVFLYRRESCQNRLLCFNFLFGGKLPLKEISVKILCQIETNFIFDIDILEILLHQIIEV